MTQQPRVHIMETGRALDLNVVYMVSEVWESQGPLTYRFRLHMSLQSTTSDITLDFPSKEIATRVQTALVAAWAATEEQETP